MVGFLVLGQFGANSIVRLYLNHYYRQQNETIVKASDKIKFLMVSIVVCVVNC